MKNALLTLVLIATAGAAQPLMTNQGIQSMVANGVPLPKIVQAIKTASKIDLYINQHELTALKNAGASPSQADEILKAIHDREYNGADAPPEPAPAPVPVAKPAPAPIPAGDLLTDAEIAQAILRGLATGHRNAGAILTEFDTSPASSDYTLRVYSAKQWIEQIVADARSENQPFTIADVTPEMRRKLLHIVPAPSVQHILITDTARTEALQPVELDTSAAFAMCDVDNLRASDPKGEFFIAVAGAGEDKLFLVTDRVARILSH